MRFCIEKNFIGTKQHLVWSDDKVTWTSEIPSGIWLCNAKNGSFDELLKVHDAKLKSQIPASHQRSIQQFITELENIPWRFVLTPNHFREFLKETVEEIKTFLLALDQEYYHKVFKANDVLFQSLQGAKIDEERRQLYLTKEANSTNRVLLESFAPNIEGFAKITQYNRFATKTGRLTVDSGPQILTLKKQYRDIISSRYEGGKIFYVDFKALEARAALTIMETEISSPDPYEEFSKNLFQDEFPRSVVKLVTLANLYGSGIEALRDKLSITRPQMQLIVNELNKLFDVKELQARLRAEWIKGKGSIRNFYGRTIHVEDPSNLINYFIQSTSVDIAMTGFTQIIQTISAQQSKITPIFILHDALFLDVSPIEFENLTSIVAAGEKIPGMKNQFFLDISPLEQSEE